MAPPPPPGWRGLPGESFVASIGTPDDQGAYYLTNYGGVVTSGNAQFSQTGGGSYLGLPPDQRQGFRTFTGIELLPGGGYRLKSNRGESYDFPIGGPSSTPSQPITPVIPPPPPPPGSVPPPTNDDAFIRLKGILDEYGLGSLAQWAKDQLVAGRSETEVTQLLRDTTEYKQRFAALEDRKAKGLAPISPAEYLAYERTAAQLMRSAGLPAGFYDQADDFRRLLANDVSVNELNQRVDTYKTAVYESDQTVRDELQRLYGVGPDLLTAYFIDPDRAFPMIEKQFRASQLGGEATRTGYGQLSGTEAEGLTTAGISVDAARQGFGELARSQELFTGLPGQSEENIGRETQLGTLTGAAGAAEKVKRRAEKRKATFEGGGRVASGERGVSGLSRSNT